MIVAFIIMCILLIVSFFIRNIFGWVYPLLQTNKWERKYARIIVQHKKPIDEIIEEFYTVTKEKMKEEKIKTRKEKLKKLNKI